MTDGHKKGQPLTVGDLHIHDNKGPTQINIGSPGSRQVINEQRELMPNVDVVAKNVGTKWILSITFHQTAGHWEAGVPFWVQLETSGPYEKASFVGGMPTSLMGFTGTEGVPEAAAKGHFELKTDTPPRPNEPLVLEIVSDAKISATGLRMSPVRAEK